MKYIKLADRLDVIAADMERTAGLTDMVKFVGNKFKTVIDAVKTEGLPTALKGLMSLVKSAPQKASFAAQTLIKLCNGWLDDVESAVNDAKKLKAIQQKKASLIVRSGLDFKTILLTLALIASAADNISHALKFAVDVPSVPGQEAQQIKTTPKKSLEYKQKAFDIELKDKKGSFVEALDSLKERTTILSSHIKMFGMTIPYSVGIEHSTLTENITTQKPPPPGK